MAKFKKGDSGNPAGRPPGKGALHKFIAELKCECLADGEQVPTIKDVRVGLSLLLNAPYEKLEKIIKNKATPASFYVFAEELLGGKNRDKLLLQIMEHAYGKPFTQLPEDAADNELKITIINKTDDPEII